MKQNESEQETGMPDNFRRYSSLWKATVKNGGARSDGKKSYLQPFMSALLNDGNSNDRGNSGRGAGLQNFLSRNFHIVAECFSLQGKAILGLGLTQEEILEIAELLETDEEQLLQEFRIPMLIIYPELKDDEDVGKKFWSKVQHLMMFSKFAPSLLAFMQNIKK